MADDIESGPPGGADVENDNKDDKTEEASADKADGDGKPDADGDKNVKQVKVKKWNAVAFWAYDIDNDVCAICHNQLMVPCITCEAEPHHAEECSVAWGQCGHSYHFHCITRWLKTRSTCPLDDEEWDFVQY